MYKKLGNQSQLSREAADHIKELISSEKLKAGDKLPNEMQLAELFGVSRPTVREAVKGLMSENLVVIVRGKGTFVAKNPGVASDPLGLRYMADRNLPLSLIEARRIIEPEVARLAAKRAQAADIRRLEALLKRMEGIVTRDAQWVEVELEFHGGIARATQNPVIMRIVPVVVEAIVKTLRYAPRTVEDHRKAFREHSAIFAAIRDRSPQKAFLAMSRHLAASYRRTVTRGSAAG
jgi:GntR family transcriptional repressor for pyruvate dehydrogenase complex